MTADMLVDTATAAGPLIAVLGILAASWFAVRSARAAEQSARSAAETAQAAVESVEHARRSAGAAEQSAEHSRQGVDLSRLGVEAARDGVAESRRSADAARDGVAEARRSADAAYETVHEAKRAADAAHEGVVEARRSAMAAEQSVALSREEIALVRENFHLEQAPTFRVGAIALRDGFGYAEFVLLRAPSPIQVKARIVGAAFYPMRSYLVQELESTMRDMVDQAKVRVEFEYDEWDPSNHDGQILFMELNLTIFSIPVGGSWETNKSWEAHQRLTWGTDPRDN